MHRLLLTAIATAFVSNLYAQAPDKAGLDTLLSRLAQHHKMMGCVQFSKGGTVVYSNCVGEARRGSPNSPATVFRIGSISKTFTATMVMQQIEAGKLSLEDKLAKWFPKIPNAANITVDHLLAHQSGIHSVTDDPDFIAWQDTVHAPAGVVARMEGFSADFEPGAKSDYSNSNYILLGYILEKVSGKSYAALLRERITGPLKLKATGIGPTMLPAKGPDAQSFSRADGQWEADKLSSIDVPGGAGAIASTVPELAVFMDALMRGRLVSEASLAMMKEIRNGYGRGLIRFPFYDRVAYGHNGQIDNFSGNLAYFPKDSTVLSVVCNGLNFDMNDLMIGVLSLYYGRPYKIPDFAAALRLTAAQKSRLEGVYSNAQIGMEITIRATEDGLTAQATGQGPLQFTALTPAKFENSGVGAELSFPDDAAPAATMTLHQGGGVLEFVRKR